MLHGSCFCRVGCPMGLSMRRHPVRLPALAGVQVVGYTSWNSSAQTIRNDVSLWLRTLGEKDSDSPRCSRLNVSFNLSFRYTVDNGKKLESVICPGLVNFLFLLVYKDDIYATGPYCAQGRIFCRVVFATFSDGIILRKSLDRRAITLSGLIMNTL